MTNHCFPPDLMNASFARVVVEKSVLTLPGARHPVIGIVLVAKPLLRYSQHFYKPSCWIVLVRNHATQTIFRLYDPVLGIVGESDPLAVGRYDSGDISARLSLDLQYAAVAILEFDHAALSGLTLAASTSQFVRRPILEIDCPSFGVPVDARTVELGRGIGSFEDGGREISAWRDTIVE